MKNDGKILSFGRFAENKKIYFDIARRRLDEGDNGGALGVLFSALKLCSKKADKADVIAEIADTYTDLGYYELANQYWIRYLDCAPRDKKDDAYLELALNCVAMGDFFTAGFYFHEKVKTLHGFPFTGLNIEDSELLDVLKEGVEGLNKFYLAYPPKPENYARFKKEARRAFEKEDFENVVKSLKKIPDDARTEDDDGEMALSYYYMREDEKALDVCRRSIEKTGGNLTAYGNLSTIYGGTANEDKSNYYYEKAVACYKGKKGEAFKLAACAIDRKDHQRAATFLENAIKTDRPDDVVLKLYYAIALMNVGRFEDAKKRAFECLATNPEDGILAFYADFSKLLVAGDKTALSALPLDYDDDLPKKYKHKYDKLFNDVINNFPVRGKKKAEAIDAAKICAYSKNLQLAKNALFLLARLYSEESFAEFSKKLLLSVIIEEDVKAFILITLITEGYAENVGVESEGMYSRIKLRKMPFDSKKEAGKKMYVAYGLCVTKYLFIDVSVPDKALFKMNDFYKNNFKEIEDDKYYPNDIAAAAVISACGKKENFKKQTCALLGASVAKVNDFLKKVTENVCKNN